MKPVSGRAMARILRSRGWILEGVRGSHHAFVRPDEPGRIIVPIHGNRDLTPGTQRSIMRQAGLTDEDL